MTLTAAHSAVDELATEFWEGFLERNPVYATFLGDERYADRLEDPGPEGRAREVEALREVLVRAERIDGAGLELEDRITLDMLQVIARIGLAQHEQQLHHFASVDQLGGPQGVPGDLSRFQRVDTPERFQRLLERLRGYPGFIAAHEANLEEGVAERRTAARAVVERTLDQVRRLVDTPVDESPLMVALTGLDEDQRAALRTELERSVSPALGSFLCALERYAPHARAGDGLWALPDGGELYRTAILANTTLELDPAELHDFGKQRIAEIDAEREGIARELGHDGQAGLRAALDSDPENRAARPEQLVDIAREQIQRAAALAPRFFGRQPRAACEVRPIEPYIEREMPAAYYYPPAADGSRPGIYYVNTYQPEDRPLHRLAATTYHEAVPGHHFQIAIETELDGLHPFRRLGSRLAGVAYPEGWGLYSERLADEMGLFTDRRERFGMLDAQAWRAARLVVDTGLHAFRWDRERAIRFLVAVGLTRMEAEVETDRYIGWPAQALSYMTGQREIEALRHQLEARDGTSFDLRRFHDEVLGHGSLPLATLRRELPGWVLPALE